MSGIKISQLSSVTLLNPEDTIPVVQNGITKKVAAKLLASNGESAYDIWIKNGGAGTEEDFLLSLKGISGPKGEAGPQGPQGERGPVGPKGEAGIVDTKNFYTKEEVDDIIKTIISRLEALENKDITEDKIIMTNGKILSAIDGRTIRYR